MVSRLRIFEEWSPRLREYKLSYAAFTQHWVIHDQKSTRILSTQPARSPCGFSSHSWYHRELFRRNFMFLRCSLFLFHASHNDLCVDVLTTFIFYKDLWRELEPNCYQTWHHEHNRRVCSDFSLTVEANLFSLFVSTKSWIATTIATPRWKIVSITNVNLDCHHSSWNSTHTPPHASTTEKNSFAVALLFATAYWYSF